MSFNYDPMTEEEIQSINLVPEGIYPFETISANEKISKSSGNSMIELIHRVWGKDNIASYL